jgi:hypothetical protein
MRCVKKRMRIIQICIPNNERISEREQNVARVTKQRINVSTKFEENTICAHNLQNSTKHSISHKLNYKLH